MNRIPLDQAVAERLEVALAEHNFLDVPERGGQPRSYAAPTVVVGWVPPNLDKSGAVVAVLSVSGSQDAASRPGTPALETVQISCRVQAVEGDDEPTPYTAGPADLRHLINLICRDLLESPLLEQAYRLNRLDWQAAKGQSGQYEFKHPFYIATITTEWQAPAVTANLSPSDSVRLMEDGYGGD